jgi:predicted dehydrogenase/threonine dehydrogenase-like Zn-dependent dehydrogenase
MIQALIKKGVDLGEEVPSPIVSDGAVLIKTIYSCISAGTEISTVANSGIPLIKRALNQPENVKKVFEIFKKKGFSKTYSKIKGEVESGKPTGYSLSGIIVGVGKDVNGFAINDHVTASGAGIANHAEFVNVPINLVTKIPKGMNLKNASTVTLGAIALQGVRRASLRIGEFGVVFGTGILGLITVQILKASGIRVAAVDLDDTRLKLAKELGADLIVNPASENAVKIIAGWSDGHGADAILFTASTASSEPLSESFQMCRKKGKVILVGVVKMNINRADMYKKELDFLISTSYGPGRYDSNYEVKGLDYPYAYVRWTENRNMQEYLRLVDSEQINLAKIISKTYSIDQVSEAFESIKSDNKKPLMVILEYGKPEDMLMASQIPKDTKIVLNDRPINKKLINVALIGAGSFATNMHLPNLRKMKDKFQLVAVVDRNGHKAKNIANQFGAKYSTTEIDEVLLDKDVDLVMITTRHNTHANIVHRALNSGKHVFVEKPLATNKEELDMIKTFYSDSKDKKPILMVGFNRRFSKYVQEIKKHTNKRVNPLFIRYRMNAGYIPTDHWVHNNGGRIVGEGCHIIDLMIYLTDSTIQSISFESLTPNTTKFSYSDNKSIILKFKDGSICVLDYFAVGNKAFPKEYMEVHFDEKTIVVDDYKQIKGYGVHVKKIKSNSSQKGQFEELESLYKVLCETNSEWPISLKDMIQTTEISLIID